MSEAVTVGAVGLVAALVLPMFAIRILRRLGAVDEPNHRSSHTVPTVRGVGAASLAALMIGGAVGIFGDLTDRLTVVVLVVAATMAILGLIEDLRGLKIILRLAVQLAIGLSAGAILVLNDGGNSWVIALVAVWIAGYVNVANFMDGVDSISGLHGIVAGSYYAALGMYEDQLVLMVVGTLTVAIFAGFLPWNVVGARRVFLGDVGSYLLGALVALLAAAAWLGGCGAVAAVAPTTVYIADTTWTLFRRALRHQPLTHAHRTHVYQRLTSIGLTHMASGVTVALVSAMSATAALVARTALIPQFAAVLIIGTVNLVYLSLPRVVATRRSGDRAMV